MYPWRDFWVRRLSALIDTGPNYKAGFASVAPGASKFYIQNNALLEVKWY